MASPNSPFLRVNVYAPKSDLIKELLNSLEAVNAKVAGIKGTKLKLFTDADYLISWGVGRDAKRAIREALKTGGKLVVLLPLVTKNQKEYKNSLKFISKIPKNIKCKIVWVGESVESFSGNFNQGYKDYFLISSHDAARVITKAMFSFWGEVSETTITDKIPQAALSQYQNTKARKKVFQGDIRGKLFTPGTDTISRIFTKPVVEVAPIKTTKRKPNTKRRKLIALISLLILVILTPLILLMFAGVLGYLGYNNLITNPYQSERLFERAEKLAAISSQVFPIKPTLLMYQTVSVGKSSAQIALTTNQIKEGVLSDNHFDLTGLSHKLKLDLDKLYSDSAFLETEVGENNFFDRDVISHAREVVPYLPLILGEGSPKSYLVLIQEGSGIESLALVTFQDGKMLNIQEISNQSINSQFKGQALPPNPAKIEDVAKAGNFSDLAKRTIWFVDKSIYVPVDGVVLVQGKDRWKNLKNLSVDLSDLTNKNIQIYFTNPQIQDNFESI